MCHCDINSTPIFLYLDGYKTEDTKDEQIVDKLPAVKGKYQGCDREISPMAIF